MPPSSFTLEMMSITLDVLSGKLESVSSALTDILLEPEHVNPSTLSVKHGTTPANAPAVMLVILSVLKVVFQIQPHIVPLCVLLMMPVEDAQSVPLDHTGQMELVPKSIPTANPTIVRMDGVLLAMPATVSRTVNVFSFLYLLIQASHQTSSVLNGMEISVPNVPLMPTLAMVLALKSTPSVRPLTSPTDSVPAAIKVMA